MPEDLIRYEALVLDALRGVVRSVLQRVLKRGVPGDHHFFITFDTQAPGVGLSKRLKDQYPQEMTIVLQHQFWDLAVTDDRFEVRLSFNNIPERLVIPFGAVRIFQDPSVHFALALRSPEAAAEEKPGSETPLLAAPELGAPAFGSKSKSGSARSGNSGLSGAQKRDGSARGTSDSRGCQSRQVSQEIDRAQVVYRIPACVHFNSSVIKSCHPSNISAGKRRYHGKLMLTRLPLFAILTANRKLWLQSTFRRGKALFERNGEGGRDCPLTLYCRDIGGD